jgi:O6-methylguanine-DNA--protein-cysteine methyltransferase
MTSLDTHRRLITLVQEMPCGNVFTSAEIAKKLNQEVRGIGRRLGDIDTVEKVPMRQAGTWRRI